MTTHTSYLTHYNCLLIVLGWCLFLILKVEINQSFILGPLLFPITLHSVHRLCHLPSSMTLNAITVWNAPWNPTVTYQTAFLPFSPRCLTGILNMFWPVWNSGTFLLNVFHPIVSNSYKWYKSPLRNILLTFLLAQTFDVSAIKFP